MWVIVRGGLGNQMFQAAYAIALGARFNVTPRFADLSASARVPRAWELGAFGIRAEPVSLPVRLSLAAAAVADQKLQRLGLSGWPGVLSEHIEYAEPPRVARAPRVLCGYWQGERYFQEQATRIRAQFRLAVPEEGPALPDPDADRPTVAIHVRRGDYVSDPTARSVHLVCDAGWYRAAWTRMRGEVPGARAFVFSDDPDWARDNLALDGDVDYGPGSPGAPAWVDLARMSRCQHFIISNSSYSWWAAWLGEDPAKRVIAPREWFRGRSTAALGICPPGWTLS